MKLFLVKRLSRFKKNKSIRYVVFIIPIVLFFQNCGKSGDNAPQTGSTVLPSTDGTQGTTPTPTTGGYNKIPPVITNTLPNQILYSGLFGRYSATRSLMNVEITADPGAGEGFQTVTLKCVLTGHADIQTDCNNKNFANGKVTFNVSPRERRECLSGTLNLRYWVEDSDPLGVGVPVLKSAERNITIQVQNTCYAEAKLYSTEKSGQDNFGSTVKLTANYLFASAPGNDLLFSNSGAVLVYTKSGTQWVQSQVLKVSESAPDLKVSTMAASGNHLLVGSAFSDAEVGAVFAFHASGTTFSEIQVIKPTSPNSFGFDHFGQAVATDGAWLAIGAPNDSTGSMVARGAIYFYQWVTNAWVFRSKVLGQKAYAQLGTSLSMSPSYLVAGAPDNFAGQLGVGSVYVYSREGVFVNTLVGGPGVAVGTIFGATVAINNNNLVVGAPLAAGAVAGSGAAYVYAFETGAWGYKQKLQAPDGLNGDEFGVSLDISGNNIVIGARRESADNYRKGSAYHFKFGTTWTHSYKIMARDRADRDYFGTSVSIYNSGVAVGSYLDDGPTGNFVDGLGAVYVYGLN